MIRMTIMNMMNSDRVHCLDYLVVHFFIKFIFNDYTCFGVA